LNRSRTALPLRWRKTDSNSRSHREGKGYGEPLQARHRRLGPESVSGSAFRAAVSDWQRPEEPFAGAGPMVRIRFPPAESQARTVTARKKRVDGTRRLRRLLRALAKAGGGLVSTALVESFSIPKFGPMLTPAITSSLRGCCLTLPTRSTMRRRGSRPRRQGR
jgi:hypothetical protein